MIDKTENPNWLLAVIFWAAAMTITGVALVVPAIVQTAL